MAQRRPGVLIVDDRPEQRCSLSAVVQDLTDDVVAAASGADALRWLLKREFAVILLDVNMPDCDGFETAALIRQRRSSRTTPIIFVTSHGDEDRAARGYARCSSRSPRAARARQELRLRRPRCSLRTARQHPFRARWS